MTDVSEAQIFPYGSPVTGEELIGREEPIRQILRDIRGGQHLLLPGPRRTGKSSVVLEVLRRLRREGNLTVYVDISAVNTKRELAREIVTATLASRNMHLARLLKSVTTKLKELLRFKEFKIAYEEFELIATLQDPHTSDEDQLTSALDFPEQYAAKKRRQLVYAFDEFGEIGAIDSHIITKMRAVFQHHKQCVYLFTGSQESILREIFSNPEEPFFGFTKQIALPPIKTREFADYLKRKFTKALFKISDETAFELCRWVNTHPFYTKVFASSVYECAALSNVKTIGMVVLKEGYYKSFLQLKPQLEVVWFDLGKATRFLRQVCCHLALYGSQSLFSREGLKRTADSAHIAQALLQLERKGIIKKVGRGRYIFENYFFRDFVLSQISPEYFQKWSPPTGVLQSGEK